MLTVVVVAACNLVVQVVVVVAVARGLNLQWKVVVFLVDVVELELDVVLVLVVVVVDVSLPTLVECSLAVVKMVWLIHVGCSRRLVLVAVVATLVVASVVVRQLWCLPLVKP